MPHTQLIGFLTVFLLHTAATPVFAAGEQEQFNETDCEAELSASQAPTGLQIPMFHLHSGVVAELGARGDYWLSWHATEDGRALLGTLDGDSELKVFEPLTGTSPVYTATAQPGADFTRAGWTQAAGGEIAAGDTHGNYLRYQIGKLQVLESEFQGDAVEVLPAPMDDIVALGLGNLARVRIMPVGSVRPERDLMAEARVTDVQTHRTQQGRRLLAVMSERAIQVFDLDLPDDQPIFSRPVENVSQVHWIVDDSGESALLFVSGGELVIEYPLRGRPPLTRSVPEGAELQPLRTAGGEVLILVSSANNAPEILELRQNMFVARATLQGSAPAEALVEGSSGTVYLAYVSAPSRSQRRLHIARLSDINRPLFTLAFDGDDQIKKFALHTLGNDRHLLAVGTTSKIYVLELRQVQQ